MTKSRDHIRKPQSNLDTKRNPTRYWIQLRTELKPVKNNTPKSDLNSKITKRQTKHRNSIRITKKRHYIAHFPVDFIGVGVLVMAILTEPNFWSIFRWFWDRWCSPVLISASPKNSQPTSFPSLSRAHTRKSLSLSLSCKILSPSVPRPHYFLSLILWFTISVYIFLIFYYDEL